MNKEKRDKKICKRLAKDNALIVLRDNYDENELPIIVSRFAIEARSTVTDSGERIWSVILDEPLTDNIKAVSIDNILGYMDDGCGDLTGLSRHLKSANPPYTREEEDVIKQQAISMLGLGPGNYYISETFDGNIIQEWIKPYKKESKEVIERNVITINIDRHYESIDSSKSQMRQIIGSGIEVLLNSKKVFMEEHRAFLDDLLGVPPIRQTRHGIAGAVNLLESLLVGDHKFDYLSQESLKNIVCQSIAEDGFRMMRLASGDETRARSARFSQEEIDLHKHHN